MHWFMASRLYILRYTLYALDIRGSDNKYGEHACISVGMSNIARIEIFPSCVQLLAQNEYCEMSNNQRTRGKWK